jgi:small basic protein
MWWAILGFILGAGIGLLCKFSIPPEYARYTAVAILAALDSVFGAVRADLSDEYDNWVFISGLGFNMVVAAGITYLGDRLGLDLYIAVLVAFIIRIFMNIGSIRRHLLAKIRKKD